MFYYRVYGWNIECDMELPMLVVGSSLDIPDLKIRAGKMSQEILDKYNSGYFAHNEEEAWVRNNTCYMLINKESITYEVRDWEKSHPEWMGTYLLGWGLAVYGLVRGETAIHCSAVRDDRGAVLICGSSGCGKSTVTASFLSKGYKLMADDVAMIKEDKDGKVWVYPAFPFQKLVRNEVLERGLDTEKLEYINETKDKFLVPWEGEFKTEPEELRLIIMLGKEPLTDENQEIRVFESRGLDKLWTTAENLFLKELLKQECVMGETGKKVLKIAESAPLFRIMRPEGKNTVKEVVNAALDLAAL